jgi:hypothetical protein
MRLTSTKSFSLLAAAVAAMVLGGCSNKSEILHGAETEGLYVNVGELKYQVQISRQLNPAAISEDKTFVKGIEPASAAELGEDEILFAIFVRIENETDKEQTPASSFSISDTDGNIYTPVKQSADNPFAYTGEPVRAKSFAPDPDSVPTQVGSIGGLELLFKIKRQSLDNRPLEFHIKSFFPDDESTVTLDV